MNKELTLFTGVLLLLAVATGLVVQQFVDPSYLILILIVLASATWAVYFFIQRTHRGNFVRNYLLTIVLKLLAGGIFIFILLYLDKSGAGANATLFMTAYLLFTGLEVGFLLRRSG